MDISKIDKNFAVPAEIQHEGIKFYNVEEAPFKIYGVRREGDLFRRLPEAVAASVSPGVLHLHSHTAGGRVRFVTDGTVIAIHAEMEGLGRMNHFAFAGSAGFDLYTGSRYVKTFVPPLDMTDGYDSLLDFSSRFKAGEKRVFTIHFPLYSRVRRLFVGVKEGCVLEAAPEYRFATPVVYYGSSITQGGCASRPGNAYQNIISAELDCDHINLGFSGNAKGEPLMADYIAGLNMSAFVLDYDHNAPTPEHLAATHEPFFKRIRAAHPDLPILILTRPQYYLSAEEQERLAIARTTYENALAAGDKNVYFIAGPDLVASVRNNALVDNTHPNDAGFVSMARAIGPVVAKMLGC